MGPQVASSTSAPLASNALIKGMHRVAWPRPQSKGATRTFIIPPA